MEILGFATGVADTIIGTELPGFLVASTSRRGPYVRDSHYWDINSSSDNQPFISFNCNQSSLGDNISWWFSAYYNRESNFVSGREILRLERNDDSAILRITSSSGSSGQWTLRWNDGSTELTVGGLNLYTSNRIDIQYEYGASGAVRIYLDGSLAGEITGDTTVNAETPRKVKFTADSGQSSSFAVQVAWSSMFLADNDTRGVQMVQHTLTGDSSTYNDFTGTYSDVDVVASLGDSSMVTGFNIGDTQTYSINGLPSGVNSGYEIIAVATMARASSNGLMDNISSVIYDGVNTVEGATIDMDDIIQPRKTVHYSAADGGAWDSTKLSNTEFGVRIKQ